MHLIVIVTVPDIVEKLSICCDGVDPNRMVILVLHKN